MSNENIIPLNHLAIIPDGNRRWARGMGLNPWEGHKRGSEAFDMILRICREKDIHFLTIYGFSTENWKRDEKEVKFLMELFTGLLVTKKDLLVQNQIRARHIGRKDRLPEKMLNLISDVEKATESFTEWNLQIALDYGGRDEIIRAANKAISDAKEGKISQVTEESFANYLDTAGIPDPDLILRTSGEKRVSGLLTYEAIYSEFEFYEKPFPEMAREDFEKVIDDYYNRQRRFGGG